MALRALDPWPGAMLLPGTASISQLSFLPRCSQLVGNALSGTLPKQLFSGMRALRSVNVSGGHRVCWLCEAP